VTNIEDKIDKLIEEARAIDRRKSALKHGIIPQGNWKYLERQARK
jgi:vacuolar-type H+-ATPase subunit D/Vma8